MAFESKDIEDAVRAGIQWAQEHPDDETPSKASDFLEVLPLVNRREAVALARVSTAVQQAERLRLSADRERKAAALPKCEKAKDGIHVFFIGGKTCANGCGLVTSKPLAPVSRRG